MKRTSWADCGKGSAHGYCKDRPDAWSDLGAEHVNWTGATATLLLGAQYAVWIGLYPIVTSQYRSTTLYQVSYQIQ